MALKLAKAERGRKILHAPYAAKLIVKICSSAHKSINGIAVHDQNH